jgi:hypothetical protein
MTSVPIEVSTALTGLNSIIISEKAGIDVSFYRVFKLTTIEQFLKLAEMSGVTIEEKSYF